MVWKVFVIGRIDDRYAIERFSLHDNPVSFRGFE
jgi:hypothetical protein